MVLRSHRARLATTLLAAAAAGGIPVDSSRVAGAEGDGVVQPGDRTAPGRCSAGPVVGGVAFTAEHCTVDSIDGQRLDQLGSSPDPDGGPPGLDAQWFSTAAPITATITTPNGDVPVAGVLRPWPGMRVHKTGWVSGTTVGTVYDGPDVLLAASSVKGLQVCHGDSGAVVYAEVGPARDVYIVGMVTNGNGGTNRVTGEEEPNGTCSEFPPLDAAGVPDYWATIRRVDALCAAAGLDACADEAGRVFGGLVGVTGSEDGIVVDAWAFDASDVHQSVTLSISVDGAEPDLHDLERPRARTSVEYSLPPWVATGGPLRVATADGIHQVCITALNRGEGVDLDFGCRTVRVGQRFPGLVGDPRLGDEGVRRWTTRPADMR